MALLEHPIWKLGVQRESSPTTGPKTEDTRCTYFTFHGNDAGSSVKSRCHPSHQQQLSLASAAAPDDDDPGSSVEK